MTSPRRLALQAWLAAKQAASAAVSAAAKPVLEALRPPKKRRRPGESWTDEDGRRWTYWPDARDEEDRLDYFSPGGARRWLDRYGCRPERW